MGKALGRHFICDLRGCPFEVLDDADLLAAAACLASEEAGATILDVSEHQFSPNGVTVLVLLAESHLAIHTWPEHGEAAVDVFTCGDSTDPGVALDTLVAQLQAQSFKVTRLERMSR